MEIYFNGFSAPEKLITLQEAADILGCYYWQLQRAVKRGEIPSYRPFNSRKLVRLSEVVAFIDSSRQGGGV
jgi:excisionase family DNA binding protein